MEEGSGNKLPKIEPKVKIQELSFSGDVQLVEYGGSLASSREETEDFELKAPLARQVTEKQKQENKFEGEKLIQTVKNQEEKIQERLKEKE